MRKWLIGLGFGLIATGGIGVTVWATKRWRDRKRMANRERATEQVYAFLRMISLMRIEVVENTVIRVPDAKSWIDRFEGSVAGEGFQFDVIVEGESVESFSGAQRGYVLKWRNALVQAQAHPSEPGAEPHVFERIHRTFKQFMDRAEDIQP